MVFDPFDISANAGAAPQAVNPVTSHSEEEEAPVAASQGVDRFQLDSDTIVITDKATGKSRQIKIRPSTTKQELNNSHWTPDKFTQDGQIRAGEMTEEQEEFLKTTEFVK